MCAYNLGVVGVTLQNFTRDVAHSLGDNADTNFARVSIHLEGILDILSLSEDICDQSQKLCKIKKLTQILHTFAANFLGDSPSPSRIFGLALQNSARYRKNVQNSARFQQLSTLIVNISGMD